MVWEYESISGGFFDGRAAILRANAGGRFFYSKGPIKMNQYLTFSIQKLIEILAPLAIFIVTLIFGFILRRLIFVRLTRWSKRTKAAIDDIIITSIRGPFIVWFLILGLYFALGSSRIPDELTGVINKILLILGIFSVTFVVANISAKLIRIYSGKVETALPVTSLTQNISRIIIFAIGILIILNSLGVSITPILATLGVGVLPLPWLYRIPFLIFSQVFILSLPSRLE